MSPTRTLDVSGLADDAIDTSAPLYWGQVLMMVIESTVILMMIALFFYVRNLFTVWPPPRIPPAPTLAPSLAIAALVLSCVPLYFSGKATEEKRLGAATWWLVANVALAIVFLLFRWKELVDLPYKWNTDIYGSFAWSLLVLHTLHGITDVLESVVFVLIGAAGRVGAKQQVGFKVDALYWYWITGLGVVLYPLLYWYPNAAIGAGR